MLKAQPDEETLFLVHANVIDILKGSSIPDMTIYISENKILKVASSDQIEIPKKARIIDCTGKYIIPGLWDMHVHLGDASSETLPLFIANGITGVRDMGTLDFDSIRKWRTESLSGKRVGPRIIAAGPILDGGKMSYSRVLVNDPSEAKAAVDSLAEIGVDFIKVHEHLSRDTYFAIAKESRKLNIPFAGHVPLTGMDYLVSGMEASVAGQKSLEHMFGIPLLADARLREMKLANDTKENIMHLFNIFNQNKTFITPTLSASWISIHRQDSSIENDNRMKYIPQVLKDWWAIQMKDWSGKYLDGQRYVLEARMKLIPLLRDAGVPILAGTDLGSVYVHPGSGLHDELKILVQAGLSPVQALQTATINPAIFFNKEKEPGLIEEGKNADLVILDKNPLEDISNVGKISSVIFNGEVFTKDDINKLLKEREESNLKTSKKF